jgi:diheme cytochrome c
LVALILLINGVFIKALADDDDHEEKKWYKKIFDREDDDDHHNSSKKYKNKYITPVNNPTYEKECGACHFPYQPELLPSGSWKKIMAVLDDHFGKEIEIDTESINVISGYLISNSAEKSSAKRAVKIVKSLRGRTPIRISETPYIIEKHDEVDPIFFNRESIGSLANCTACHITAEKGIYDDDDVKIPK